MMMVETELRQSSIHGVGVFLTTPVREGELIWRSDTRIDRVYSQEELASLPDHVQRYLRTYSTWHERTQLFVLCGDNGRYVNHADAPSIVSNAISFGEDHAARPGGRRGAHVRLHHDLRPDPPRGERILAAALPSTLPGRRLVRVGAPPGPLVSDDRSETMPSSVVRTLTYQPKERRLDVVFTSGRAYSYHDVPSAVFEAMKASFAKGEFFNRHLRGRYQYTRQDRP